MTNKCYFKSSCKFSCISKDVQLETVINDQIETKETRSDYIIQVTLGDSKDNMTVAAIDEMHGRNTESRFD